jgi:hypothetical protein
MARSTMTPLGAVARGMLAGAVGTVAMDLLAYLRYKRGGGESRLLDWEFSAGITDWDKAPAPAQVAKRLYEGFFQRKLPAERAALANNLMHWGYGLSWGVFYGLMAGTLCPPYIRSGLEFGAAVFTSDYVVLPLAKLYKPIWEYDAATVARDLSSHMVYGVGTAVAFSAAARR